MMVSHVERVQWTMERMGAATWQEGEAMVEALQDEGYQWREEPGVGLILEPEPSEAEWAEMMERAVTAARRRPYRAAIYRAPSGQETVLTTPEQQHLPEARLLEAAVAQALRAGLVGHEPHQVSEDVLRERIVVEEYHPA